ncbi:hypothetical protein JTB14_018424 [Gonioctena quinquepunctata]|nr:hypothetical protein JTB14_018424 [Gonioctena quinquepunctata]
MLFGSTCDNVRKLAYQLAGKNNICHRFNVENEMAGWDWLRGFRQRNPKISLRNPEPTSADEMVKKHKIGPSRFWNVDEIGRSTVQRPQKVFDKKAATDIAQEQEQDPVDNVINLLEVSISKPSTSKGDDEITRQDISNPSTVKSSSSWVRPEEVSPIPRIENTKRKRQTTGSQALTESPMLAEIKTRAETKRAAKFRRAANRAKKNIQSQLNEDEEKENNIYIEDDD